MTTPNTSACSATSSQVGVCRVPLRYCLLAGPIGMGVAMAVGLFDRLDSVALVPTHVWDAVPGDIVSSVILATAAATAAQIEINRYKNSTIGSNEDPLVVHAGTSTTYPISFVEAFYAGLDFVQQNPPPFRLPGGSLFSIPLDYRPDEAAVKRCKYWTAWKVWGAVRLLEALGQHKTARRLKYGHLAWEIQNSTKTDRNLFFGSKNLQQLEAQLDGVDADSNQYIVTWTLKNGGWPRYISTNIAGMYRIVFGISIIKGLEDNDFKFIPAKSVKPARFAKPSDTRPLAHAGGAADKAQDSVRPHTPLLQTLPEEDDDQQQEDVVTAGFKGTAAAFSQIPADGASRYSDEVGSDTHGSTTGDSSRVWASADGRPSADGSANVGGIRQAISLRLGQSLSYRATTMADVQPGVVSGGALNSLRSRPVQRSSKLPSPPGSVKDL
eukprot:GHRR01009712.1.p1 GENE.GHRR01009712.1~~GHRR01009712.1.p1  ORF type:complete len:439 (+),score=125.12 GHRR01009712.1:755-2071(+)